MKNTFDVTGKRVLVVGGAGLLGSAFARAARESGAAVCLLDLDEKKGSVLAREIGASFEKVDSTNPRSIESAAKRVQKKYKTIDAVVIASYPRHPRYGAHAENVRFDDFGNFLSSHVVGYFHTARTFSKLMKNGGSVVFLGSIYGVVAPKFSIYKDMSMTMPVEYAAAKGALIQLTKYLATLYGPRGIRVNTLSPGGIFANQPRSFIREYSKHVKIGSGLLSPEDVCGALLFLLSPASKNITGQNIVVDGGWTL